MWNVDNGRGGGAQLYLETLLFAQFYCELKIALTKFINFLKSLFLKNENINGMKIISIPNFLLILNVYVYSTLRITTLILKVTLCDKHTYSMQKQKS